MIVRTVKLKLTKKQENTLVQWQNHLAAVYNWAIRRIELNANNKIYFSKYDFQNSLAGVSKQLNINSHTIQAILMQAYTTWQRCFKKIAKKPRLKGKRNKLNSIPFPDALNTPINNKIKIPLLGEIRYFKQELPIGKIKCGRIKKLASGWYLDLTINTNHTFSIKQTDNVVGIDPGFSTLLTLSNGVKIENPRELRKREKRIGQAQRSHNKKLTRRLHERLKNIKKNRNHKISRKLLENYRTIYWSDDNFKGLSRLHGKSIGEAGLGQIRDFLTYKAQLLADREIILVSSVNSTKCCSNCGTINKSLSGLDSLAVRYWVCEVCGASHDRDINAAMNILNTGVGYTLETLATK